MTIKDPPPSNLPSTWLPISPLTWPQYHLLHVCWRGEGEGESPELRCGLGRVCPLSSPAWWDGWRNCCWEASRWDGWYMLSREWRKFTCTAGNVNSRLLLFLLDGQLVIPLSQELGRIRWVSFTKSSSTSSQVERRVVNGSHLQSQLVAGVSAVHLRAGQAEPPLEAGRTFSQPVADRAQDVLIHRDRLGACQEQSYMLN